MTRPVARSLYAALALVFCLGAPPRARADAKETRRLRECAEVVNEAVGVKEEIPRDLLEKAECVVVIPGVKKAAIGFGARFGFGAAACRTDAGAGPWGRPLMVSLKGGSFGLQIGGQESDLVLLILNPKGIDYLLRSKFTLGADASIAAGPVGRTAEAATDAQMRAEILSYSRSRGVFAGLSFEGAVLKPDQQANHGVYGRDVGPRHLLLEPGRPPKAAETLMDVLNRYAPARARR